MQLGFMMNANECMGCKVCVAACKDVKDTPVGSALRRVITAEAGTWRLEQGVAHQEGVFAYSLSVACNHCSNPVCVKACKKGALRKDEETGLVLLDEEACVGCGRCAKACPYDAIQVDKSLRKAHKCDGCTDLLREGKEPACVASCLMRCLELGDVDELRADAQAREDARTNGGRDKESGCRVSSDNALLPPSRMTEPNLIVVAHRCDGGLAKEDVRVTELGWEQENA